MPLMSVGLPVVPEEPQPRKRSRVIFPLPHPGRDTSPRRMINPDANFREAVSRRVKEVSPMRPNPQTLRGELHQLLDLCERARKAAERVSMLPRT